MSRARRIYEPEPVVVRAERGVPIALGEVAIDAIREDWLVEDRWWTDHPLHRHYYELVLVNGRSVIVFFDLVGRHWHSHRA